MKTSILIADGRKRDAAYRLQVSAIRDKYSASFEAINMLKLCGVDELDAIKSVAKHRSINAKSLHLAYALRSDK